MTAETPQDAAALLSLFFTQQSQQAVQALAWQRFFERKQAERRRLVVFAMAGAFVNELSLVYEPNGYTYDVRIA